jgi:hypothetical protein
MTTPLHERLSEGVECSQPEGRFCPHYECSYLDCKRLPLDERVRRAKARIDAYAQELRGAK